MVICIIIALFAVVIVVVVDWPGSSGVWEASDQAVLVMLKI